MASDMSCFFFNSSFRIHRVMDVKAHMRLKILRSVLTSELSIRGGKLLLLFDAVWLVSMNDE